MTQSIDSQTFGRDRLINEYFRLVPQDFGMKIPDPSFLLKSSDPTNLSILKARITAIQAALVGRTSYSELKS
jgi:hypothetical protein